MNMSERGRLGGIARHHTTRTQYSQDVAECRSYQAAHPGATTFDVALELHYSDAAARRIMLAAAEISGVHPAIRALNPTHLEGIHAADSRMT